MSPSTGSPKYISLHHEARLWVSPLRQSLVDVAFRFEPGVNLSRHGFYPIQVRPSRSLVGLNGLLNELLSEGLCLLPLLEGGMHGDKFRLDGRRTRSLHGAFTCRRKLIIHHKNKLCLDLEPKQTTNT